MGLHSGPHKLVHTLLDMTLMKRIAYRVGQESREGRTPHGAASLPLRLWLALPVE
jgi:hypothetical protein